jgi:DNA mismatch repair protein MSH2
MRLTKKDQPLLRKAANAKDYTTLTVQKTGLLFTSSELKRLSGKWDVASKNYEAAQDAIVAQAVEVARTYVAPMQVRPDPSMDTSYGSIKV